VAATAAGCCPRLLCVCGCWRPVIPLHNMHCACQRQKGPKGASRRFPSAAVDPCTCECCILGAAGCCHTAAQPDAQQCCSSAAGKCPALTAVVRCHWMQASLPGFLQYSAGQLQCRTQNCVAIPRHASYTTPLPQALPWVQPHHLLWQVPQVAVAHFILAFVFCGGVPETPCMPPQRASRH
jgi:hypothetical protein